MLAHAAAVLALTTSAGARADAELSCPEVAGYGEGRAFVGSIDAIERTSDQRPIVRARVERMLLGDGLPPEVSFRGFAEIERGERRVLVIERAREREEWELICTHPAASADIFASSARITRSMGVDGRNLRSVDVSALRRESPWIALAEFAGDDGLYRRLQPFGEGGEPVVAPFDVERWIAAPAGAAEGRIEVDVEPSAGDMVTWRTMMDASVILFLRRDPGRGRFAFVDPRNGILPTQGFLGQLDRSQAVHPPH
jgi:hypothetical protein